MRADKPDRPTASIVEELRARGYIVEYAKGMPFDLLVIGHSRTTGMTACVLVEVKTDGGRFTANEIRFQAALVDRSYQGVYTVAQDVQSILVLFGDTGL
jgi:hypothetical protein